MAVIVSRPPGIESGHPAYEYDQLSMETELWSDDFQYTDYVYYAALYCTAFVQWKWAVEVITENFCTTIYRQAISALIYMKSEPVDDSIRSVFIAAVEKEISRENNVLTVALQHNSLMQYGLTSLLGASQEEDSVPSLPGSPARPVVSPQRERTPPRQNSPIKRESPGSGLALSVPVSSPARPGHVRGLSRSQEIVLEALVVQQVPQEQIRLHLMTAIREQNNQMALEMVGQLDPAILAEVVEIDSETRRTPLISAISFGLNDVALAIIERLNGDQLNVQDNNGFTALMVSLMVGTPFADAARAIIEKQTGDQLSIQDDAFLTALIVFMFCATEEIQDIGASMMGKLTPEQMNFRERSGYTALMCAVINGKRDLALELVDHLDKPQLQVTRAEKTLMEFVYEHRQLDVGVALTEKLEVENAPRFIDLMKALFHGSERRALDFLGSLTPDQLNVKDVDGKTALGLALHKNMLTVACAIFLKVIESDEPIVDGPQMLRLLFHAIRLGDDKLALALVDRMGPGDLRLQSRGKTPLTLATEYERTNTARVILAKIREDLE